MPKWPHDGLPLRALPLRVAGNAVSRVWLREAAGKSKTTLRPSAKRFQESQAFVFSMVQSLI